MGEMLVMFFNAQNIDFWCTKKNGSELMSMQIMIVKNLMHVFSTNSTCWWTWSQHSRLGAKGPPLVGEEVRKRVGT
jgi:hypothetical protein